MMPSRASRMRNSRRRKRRKRRRRKKRKRRRKVVRPAVGDARECIAARCDVVYAYACTYSRDYALTRTRINMYMYTRIISVVARGQRRERRKKRGPCTLYPFLLLARMYVPYRCARETLSPGVDARCALYPHLQVAASRGTVVPLRARKREEIAVELRPLHLRVPVRERCGRKGREPKGERRGKRKREGKTERENERDLYWPEDIQRDNALRDAPGDSKADRSSPSFSVPSIRSGLWRSFALPSPRFSLSSSRSFSFSSSSSSSVRRFLPFGDPPTTFFLPFLHFTKRDGERVLFARYLHKLCRY